MKVSKRPLQFDWDAGNSRKNKQKHAVETWECEEAFFDPKKITVRDTLHSGGERRYIVLGKTKQQRLLFIAFTIRGQKIRVISARGVTKKKEIELYEKAT